LKHVTRLAIAVLALGAGAAGAATYTASVDATNPAEIFFDTSTLLVAPGSFADLVNVSWTAPPSGGFASAAVTNVRSSGRNITFSSVQLFDGLDGTGSLLSSGADLYFSDVLVSGTQFSVKLSGTATGTAGGQYILTGSVVPVPEPETYAMMLAGVVAVGFMAARRRRRN
jgi:hypothetical protein